MTLEHWTGIPDGAYERPRITRQHGQWVIVIGRLGIVSIAMPCGPDWQDVLDWYGWKYYEGRSL